jgi:hypothetical protein
MSKEIDFLYEDPVIPTQQYSLISIVGPHAAQKCAVWGIKVRGCADSLDSAKKLSEKLNKIDPNYDIFTLETGKFAPLVVDPTQIKSEYANEELNNLIKGYMESKEQSKTAWEVRKNEQIAEAAKQGKEGAKRTPELVFHTLNTLTSRIKAVDEEKKSLLENLAEYESDWEKFTQEERDAASKVIKDTIEANNKAEAEGQEESSSSAGPSVI